MLRLAILRRRAASAAAALALSMPLAAGAAEAGAGVDRDLVRALFPQAERVTEPAGDPPAAAVLGGGRLLGYALLTDRIAPIPGYSGEPVSMLVGLGADATIRGVRIVRHQEPILVVGIEERDLERFVDQYRGRDARDRVVVGGRGGDDRVVVDGISGATITIMVLNAAITRSVRAVAESRGLPLGDAEVRALHAEIARALAAEAPAPRAPAALAGDAGREAAAGDDAPPVWRAVWEARGPRVAVLLVGLAVLATILMLQDWIARNRRLVAWLRIGFLIYTLVFVGWYALAQLSVINVLTFVHAVMRDFRWETFLVEPMIFVLWCFVAVSLLLWGRGVYCGWLCPYGALQELVNKAAQRLRVPQLPIPALVHERLVAVKYVLLLALFGLSLQSMADAIALAEVEPFKTAITLRFERAWPFVLYAGGLVVVSAFNGKFFCKYLCPLGAALAIGGRFRIFDWLRRRKECGRPCQICATECPSQAIRPTGEIDANECHYCLDCQVTFWNPYKCPPLVERRKRFERRGQEVRLTLR